MPRGRAAESLAQDTQGGCSRETEEVGRDAGLGALWLLRHELESIDHSAELGKRTGVHLPHRPAAVDFHRGFRNADIAGNLFAKATAGDVNHDFAFPGA